MPGLYEAQVSRNWESTRKGTTDCFKSSYVVTSQYSQDTKDIGVDVPAAIVPAANCRARWCSESRSSLSISSKWFAVNEGLAVPALWFCNLQYDRVNRRSKKNIPIVPPPFRSSHTWIRRGMALSLFETRVRNMGHCVDVKHPHLWWTWQTMRQEPKTASTQLGDDKSYDDVWLFDTHTQGVYPIN